MLGTYFCQVRRVGLSLLAVRSLTPDVAPFRRVSTRAPSAVRPAGLSPASCKPIVALKRDADNRASPLSQSPPLWASGPTPSLSASVSPRYFTAGALPSRLIQALDLPFAEYSWLTTCVYLAILVCELPQNLLIQRLPVAKWFSFCIVAWCVSSPPCPRRLPICARRLTPLCDLLIIFRGITVAASAAANDFVGLVIVRSCGRSPQSSWNLRTDQRTSPACASAPDAARRVRVRHPADIHRAVGSVVRGSACRTLGLAPASLTVRSPPLQVPPRRAGWHDRALVLHECACPPAPLARLRRSG